MNIIFKTCACAFTPSIEMRSSIKFMSNLRKHIKPTQEFNWVFTYIPTRLGVIIPKPIITQLNLTIIVLPLVFKRTPKILLSKTLTRVAIEVLLAFPYQLSFLVVGFYGGAYSITNLFIS